MDQEDQTLAVAAALTTANAVSLKLPSFWSSQPTLWFSQAESQFQLRGITTDATKYHHIVGTLDQHAARKAADILAKPHEAGHYKLLKDRLLAAYGLSPSQRAAKLLHLAGLGDRKPSELMDEMIELLGDEPPGFLFRQLFIEQLPSSVGMVLSSLDLTEPRALAASADKLIQAQRQAADGVLVSSAAQEAAFPPDTDPDHPNSTVAALQRPASRTAHRPSAPPPHPLRKQDGACFYHRRWGSEARNCRTPCSWQGNELAGRH